MASRPAHACREALIDLAQCVYDPVKSPNRSTAWTAERNRREAPSRTYLNVELGG
jgi:hypothetical protein